MFGVCIEKENVRSYLFSCDDVGFNAISKILNKSINLTPFFKPTEKMSQLSFRLNEDLKREKLVMRKTSRKEKKGGKKGLSCAQNFCTLLPVLIKVEKSFSLKPLLNDV